MAEAIVGARRARPDKPVLAVLMGREGLAARARGAARARHSRPTSFPSRLRARWLRSIGTRVGRAPAGRPNAARRTSISGGARDPRPRAQRTGATQLTQARVAATCCAPTEFRGAAARLATTATTRSVPPTRVGYPVVLKIVSPDVVHKTDVGGVRVGIASERELRAAYDEMLTRVAQAPPAARVDGVLVQADGARRLRDDRRR